VKKRGDNRKFFKLKEKKRFLSSYNDYFPQGEFAEVVSEDNLSSFEIWVSTDELVGD
jgi:hypothetical protein